MRLTVPNPSAHTDPARQLSKLSVRYVCSCTVQSLDSVSISSQAHAAVLSSIPVLVSSFHTAHLSTASYSFHRQISFPNAPVNSHLLGFLLLLRLSVQSFAPILPHSLSQQSPPLRNHRDGLLRTHDEPSSPSTHSASPQPSETTSQRIPTQRTRPST